MSTLRGKIGAKPGTRSIAVGATPVIKKALKLPGGRLAGAFGYIHLFTRSRDDLDARFPKLKRHLAEGGMLWVSWPKARAPGTDLTLTKIIGIGYGHGLVESKTISVDETWSAIKFTFPRKGKQYRNSYGRLPAAR